MVILTDVTTEMHKRRELRDAEAKLRVILDNVLVGIIMIDAKGKIISMNPAAVDMFGFPADEVVGQNVKMLMPEQDRGSHDGHLADYQPTGMSRVIGQGRELEGLTRTGRRFPMEQLSRTLVAACLNWGSYDWTQQRLNRRTSSAC